MRYMAWRPLLVILALTANLIGLTNTTQVLAWCNTSGRGHVSGNFFDGWLRGGVGTVGGVYGYITNYDPYVNTASSAIWIMLTDGSYYGQIGYLTNPGSPGPQQGFVQVSEPGLFDFFKYGMSTYDPIGYTALYNNTPGYFTFYQNGGLIRRDIAWFVPTQGQNFGEVLNTDDQMYGENTARAYMTGMNIYYNGGWHNFNGSSANDDSTHWANQVDSSTNIEIWDHCTTP